MKQSVFDVTADTFSVNDESRIKLWFFHDVRAKWDLSDLDC